MYESRSYSIPLLPFLVIREEEEEKRAARARTPRTRKIKKIPKRFVSVNTMYPIHPHTRRKRLSDEGRLYKDYIYKCMEEQERTQAPSFEYYDCTYTFFMTDDMILTKDGDLAKKHDVSNLIKAAEDAVFDYLLDDDSRVLSVHGHKQLTASDPRLVVTLKPTHLEVDGHIRVVRV